MKLIKKYLSYEIGIEFKACMYFFFVLFFYCMYEVLKGSFYTNIVIMLEMALGNYLLCYIQVFLFHNFDESEHLGLYQIAAATVCSLLYCGLSYGLSWFDKGLIVTILFFVYMMFSYLCLYFVYKIKRSLDTKELNQQLDAFKRRQNEKKEG